MLSLEAQRANVCKTDEKVVRTGVAVFWTLTVHWVWRSEVAWCSVIQSACVVSRVFTLLIALLWVVGELAGTWCCCCCCCSWSRDVCDSALLRLMAEVPLCRPTGLAKSPTNWKKPEAERGQRRDDGQTNEVDLMMTYGLHCARQIAKVTDRAATQTLTRRSITFSQLASTVIRSQRRSHNRFMVNAVRPISMQDPPAVREAINI